MTPLALTFMVLSWSFVLGLTAWCFARVLRSEKRPRSEPGERVDGEAGGDGYSGGPP
ncbi:MAG: hypothetical protein KY466_15875 [Gemmatimonadetes bacterium]|nr:hypothetical protein [Gemmatimonadota bacterium]